MKYCCMAHLLKRVWGMEPILPFNLGLSGEDPVTFDVDQIDAKMNDISSDEKVGTCMAGMKLILILQKILNSYFRILAFSSQCTYLSGYACIMAKHLLKHIILLEVAL